MVSLGSIRESASKAFTSIDRTVFKGRLPGGAPAQPRESSIIRQATGSEKVGDTKLKETVTFPQPRAAPRPSSPGRTSGGGGGGSSRATSPTPTPTTQITGASVTQPAAAPTPTPEPQQQFAKFGVLTEAPAPTDIFGRFERAREQAIIGEEQFDPRSTAKSAGLALAKPFVDSAQFISGIIREPKETATGVVSGLTVAAGRFASGEGFPEVGEAFGTRPTSAGFELFGEIGQAVIGGQAAKGAGKLVTTVGTRVSPSFIGVSDDLGDASKLSTLDDLGDTRKVLDLPSGQKIEVVPRGTIPTQPLGGQVKLAGGVAEPVQSAKNLFGFLDDSITVKARPGQVGIEKSFFADPFGRARVSRLGVDQRSATFADILSGDVTLKATKPQIITFGSQTVEKFPDELSDIGIKLKSGRGLSSSDELRLLEFQSKPSGQFKPIGALSREAEITLAPGEIVKKTGVAGVTLIEGKRVPIITADIGQASPKLSSLLTQKAAGTLDDLGTSNLIGQLSKESGFRVSRRAASTPLLSPLSIAGAASPLLGISGRLSSPSLNISSPLAPISAPRRSPIRAASPFAVFGGSSPFSPIGGGSRSPFITPGAPRLAPPTITPPLGIPGRDPFNLKTPALFPLPGGGTRRKLRKTKRPKRREVRKFAPSLSAVALNITAPKAPSLKSITGLGLRPLIRPRSRRRKRR
jgi:hypothetical protein